MSANSAAEAAGGRDAVAEVLRRAGTILLTTHVHPDGDGLGSLAALWSSASAVGKRCFALVPDALPGRYAFLLEGCPLEPAGRFAELADEVELIVVLDTCAREQLGPLAEAVARHRAKVAVIDHHVTADDIAAAVWRDESAAAVGVMVTELLEVLGWPVPARAAEALAAAVLTDTGWLRYANTDARALRAVGRWLEAGVRLDGLYRRIYQSDRPERLRLLGAALDSLRLYLDGRVAVMTLSREDFDRTGALDEETEDIVNEPLRIATVEVSAIVTVQRGGQLRVSLRSRGAVDVAKVAERFGGGGHARAAGFRCGGRPGELVGRLVAECAALLGE